MDDEVEGDGSEDPDPSPPKVSTCELPPNEDGNKNSGGDEVAPTSPDPSSDLGGEEADGRKDLGAPAVPADPQPAGGAAVEGGEGGKGGKGGKGADFPIEPTQAKESQIVVLDDESPKPKQRRYPSWYDPLKEDSQLPDGWSLPSSTPTRSPTDCGPGLFMLFMVILLAISILIIK